MSVLARAARGHQLAVGERHWVQVRRCAVLCEEGTPVETDTGLLVDEVGSEASRKGTLNGENIFPVNCGWCDLAIGGSVDACCSNQLA